MSSTAFRLTALSAVLLVATQAGAIGFGEITLHSRVGEPLRAEVQINAESGDSVETACFSLAPLNGSDLPVVSSGKTRLVKDENRYRLVITGSKPIVEPIFMIGLRAGCGTELQRDFVLTPAEPIVFASAPQSPSASNGNATTAPASGPRSRVAAIQEWRASEGETLENIAETLIPDNLAQQRRMLAALKRANPRLSGRPSLAEGTPVMIPDLKQRVVAERDLPTQQARDRDEPAPPPPAPAPPAPKAATPPSAAPKGGADRVLLGAPPAEIKGGDKAAPARASETNMDERMLKLEATIQSLNTQIEALDKALALTAETMSLQKKLQAAQAARATPAEPGALPAPIAKPPTASPEASSNWQEILLSALLGGAVAAGLVIFLSRRREYRAADELPLALSGQQPRSRAGQPGSRRPPGSSASAPSATPGSVAVDIPLEEFSKAPSDIRGGDFSLNEDESAIALAEIMLSFGRLESAAETLARHIDESAPDNPRPWLMLLDLYRRSGLHAQYTGLLPAIRQKFNVNPADWDDLGAATSGLQSLEDYAHIAERVTGAWATQDVMDYLYNLVHDNRHGQRSGFPLEVVEEIVLLLLVLEEAYGLRRQH